jgi:hypothetical protein
MATPFIFGSTDRGERRRTTRFLTAAVIVAGTMVGSSATAGEICGVTYQTWEDLFRQIQSKPGLTPTPSAPGFRAFKEQDRTWTITELEGNRAHPAVACRFLAGSEGSFSMQTRLACFAEKANCDKLADACRRLDELMMEELGKGRSK